MTLGEKQQSLLSELQSVPDSQQRLAMVVERGRRQPALSDADRVEANRVEGCLSQLWLVADWSGGVCSFRCDSDSAVVKGVATLLCEYYSGHSPEEILTADTAFLAQAGITQHLSANRRNGLARVEERIRAFARQCLGEAGFRDTNGIEIKPDGC